MSMYGYRSLRSPRRPLCKREDLVAYIESHISEHAGQDIPILIVTNIVKEERTRCGGPMGGDRFEERLVTEMYFGTIIDPCVKDVIIDGSERDTGDIMFTTTRYLHVSGRHHAWHDDQITLNFSTVYDLLCQPFDQELPEYWECQFFFNASREVTLIQKYFDAKKTGKCEPIRPLEIVIGSEEIQKFCMSRGEYFTMTYLKYWRDSYPDEVPLDPFLEKKECEEREDIATKLAAACRGNSQRLVDHLLDVALEMGMDKRSHIISGPTPGATLDVPRMVTELASERAKQEKKKKSA